MLQMKSTQRSEDSVKLELLWCHDSDRGRLSSRKTITARQSDLLAMKIKTSRET